MSRRGKLQFRLDAMAMWVLVISHCDIQSIKLTIIEFESASDICLSDICLSQCKLINNS